MISYLDCYPCLVRHALEASRQITRDEDLQREVMNQVLKLLSDQPKEATPVRLAAEAHRVIRSILGVEDPYAGQKKKYNSLALSMLPELRRVIAGAGDRLECAVSGRDYSIFRFLKERYEAYLNAPPPEEPLIKGSDLLALGISEGPEVGKILREVEDLHAQGKLATREETLRWVKERLGDRA